jgi:hypothetical protein
MPAAGSAMSASDSRSAWRFAAPWHAGARTAGLGGGGYSTPSPRAHTVFSSFDRGRLGFARPGGAPGSETKIVQVWPKLRDLAQHFDWKPLLEP